MWVIYSNKQRWFHRAEGGTVFWWGLNKIWFQTWSLNCKCDLRWVVWPLIVAVVQLLSCVQLFVTPWTGACQASQSFTISWSLLKGMSIKSVMPFNQLILCCPFLLLPSVFPASGSFPMSWLFSSDCQSTGASASASILPYHGYLSTHNSYVLEDVMELEVPGNHEDCNKFFSLKATTDCSNCQCSRKDGSSQCTVGWLSVHLAK